MNIEIAHQQCRQADRLVAAGKYEEAISCHGKAAVLPCSALLLCRCSARLSMELQRDSHIKQQRLIQERWKREARREAVKTRLGLVQATGPGFLKSPSTGSSRPCASPGASAAELGSVGQREYDTLLYQLQTRQTGGTQILTPVCSGSKTTKDDKTRLEEQQTTIENLRLLVDGLTNENQQLRAENERLRLENMRLHSEAADFVERSELWVLPQAGESKRKGKEIAIPQLPPLEMPAQEDLCLDDLPPLELPEDIQNELQELLDRDKL
uniref:Nuclear receptor binding factor 2b n=1 Tax=Neolamprologus brichardi TaxID=32507 RepID=A0A3Q4I9Z7_NEOBR